MRNAEVKMVAVKSKKEYTFLVNILTDYFYCKEMNCEISKKDLFTNFGANYYNIFAEEFRKQNLGVEFELKKERFSNGIRAVIIIDNKEYDEISNIIRSFLPAGRYSIEKDVVGDKKEKEYNRNFAKERKHLHQ